MGSVASGRGGGAAVGEIERPAALRPGDRIAVVAAAGGVAPDRLEAGVAVLERRGFRVSVRAPAERHRYLAGRDEDRRRALLDAFGDDEVRAVWLARGGYGIGRLLPGLDPSWLRRHGKLCIGFSDATSLLQLLVQRAGIVALHGPMVAHDVVREDASGGLDHLLAVAAGSSDWVVEVPRGIAPGEASAPLLGGCLSVLASLAGTPFAPSFAGAIALLEDTHERPQRRLDRLLVQLRQSGMLDGVRGVLFGAMPECGAVEDLNATILDCLGDLPVPIGFGAPVGHGTRHLAVPLGVRVRLSIEAAGVPGSSAGRLAGLEPAVRA